MTMKPKSMKRLLAEADAIAHLDTVDETGKALDEALEDLIAANEKAKEHRFQRYDFIARCRNSWIKQIDKAFPGSPEQRCLVALKVFAKSDGLSEAELSTLADDYQAVLALLTNEGYILREGEREEPLAGWRDRSGRVIWQPMKFDDGEAFDPPRATPGLLRWITVKTYAIT